MDPVANTHGSGGKGDPMVISSSEESDFPDIEEFLDGEGTVDAASAGSGKPVASGGDPWSWMMDSFLTLPLLTEWFLVTSYVQRRNHPNTGNVAIITAHYAVIKHWTSICPLTKNKYMLDTPLGLCNARNAVQAAAVALISARNPNNHQQRVCLLRRTATAFLTVMRSRLESDGLPLNPSALARDPGMKAPRKNRARIEVDTQTEALQGVIPLQAPGKKHLEISGAPADELVVVIGELLWTTPISGTNGGTSTVPPPSKQRPSQAQASYVVVRLVGFKFNQERGNFYAINTTQQTWTIQALPGTISPYVAWYKEWTGYPVQQDDQLKRDAQWTDVDIAALAFGQAHSAEEGARAGRTAAPAHTEGIFAQHTVIRSDPTSRERRSTTSTRKREG
ncbi:hypothetical protein GE21DRAFT_6557 [Neurospora crassa]|uniref:Uncharacterized protein n=1 Tax=Neurospora crassa (strain ATCC 24698 / 74-OR23-1A / CBS 708.71 / DSM 1257 / FGSC 987) TaxID=367110 RepID=Q7S8Y5_NEUCR|nr:hypothetical protein NCU08830 [Neurospora crassa OR74A]EAA32805.1 hypothetical protein NCU08830 [Neurospora crassa OR74A]KHE79781.1 hypothetical protein GE21DRAFT_6557 [Neurospora crassa]|eukprot:XP_962041.1 hypothetical protein NCU08830 [Neurospora crassa OR74A]